MWKLTSTLHLWGSKTRISKRLMPLTRFYLTRYTMHFSPSSSKL